MLIDLKVDAKTKFEKDDMLICDGNGTFKRISKKELLSDVNDLLKLQKQEINNMKVFLRNYQENMTKLLKEVAK